MRALYKKARQRHQGKSAQLAISDRKCIELPPEECRPALRPVPGAFQIPLNPSNANLFLFQFLHA